MQLRRHLPGFMLAFSSTASAQSSDSGLDSQIDAQWHAPNKNFWDQSVDKTINAEGTYGFIFNSSKDPRGVTYGDYNYCNMPHVRKQEYKKPSREYELEYVEVIHRHHKRTPYDSNLFPYETPAYDCSEVELFNYAAANDVQPDPIYWTPYWPSANPWPYVTRGSNCQFPQQSKGGLEDSYQHGKDLYGVYHDLLHFIPGNLNSQSVKYRVTNNVITSQVAGALIAGMYPAARDRATSVYIENSAIDSLEPAYSCNGASNLYSSYGVGSTNPAWLAHLNASSSLRTKLNALSAVDPSDSGWANSWDHYFDNLSSRQCHGFPLPRNATTGTEVDQSEADEVYRLGQYEYAFLWRGARQSLRVATGAFGGWIAEFLAKVNALTEGRQSVKYFHNVAHDGSMARLLAILQTDVMVWPGMGAEIVFEVYSKRGGGGYGYGGYGSGGKTWYVRILWGGKVFHSSHPAIGEADMIELSKLTTYLEGLVGSKAQNVVALCNGS